MVIVGVVVEDDEPGPFGDCRDEKIRYANGSMHPSASQFLHYVDGAIEVPLKDRNGRERL